MLRLILVGLLFLHVLFTIEGESKVSGNENVGVESYAQAKSMKPNRYGNGNYRQSRVSHHFKNLPIRQKRQILIPYGQPIVDPMLGAAGLNPLGVGAVNPLGVGGYGGGVGGYGAGVGGYGIGIGGLDPLGAGIGGVGPLGVGGYGMGAGGVGGYGIGAGGVGGYGMGLGTSGYGSTYPLVDPASMYWDASMANPVTGLPLPNSPFFGLLNVLNIGDILPMTNSASYSLVPLFTTDLILPPNIQPYAVTPEFLVYYPPLYSDFQLLCDNLSLSCYYYYYN